MAGALKKAGAVVDEATMNGEQYEHHVAAVLASEGWDTTVTPLSHDMGVDILAELADRRLAVQAKKYGGTSTKVKVNARQVMHLFGAAAYADCHEALLATDGTLTADARVVAEKLGVVVREIDATAVGQTPSADRALDFGMVWEKFIVPLAGTSILRGTGTTVQIVSVDNSGIRRITSGGTPQRMAIETFRWAIDRLLDGETVMRAEIHEHDPEQVSSGVLLVLSEVPMFEAITVGRAKGIRRRTES